MTSPAIPLPAAGADDVCYVVDFSAQSRRRWKGMERDPQALHLKPLANGEPGGVTRSMLGWLVDLISGRKPAYLCFCLDDPDHSRGWRRLALPEYKIKRDPRCADLVIQEDRIAQVLQMHSIPTYIQRAYEADDLIACVTEQALSYGLRVIIVGFDKDLLPLLANPKVAMWDGKESWISTGKTVRENVDKWHGCGPEHVADILALAGDGTDGIEGLEGIGIKGAAKLLLKYGSLTEVLRKSSWLPAGKVRDSLMANADKARLYRRITQLAMDANVDFDPQAARLGWTSQEAAEIDKLYHALGLPWTGISGMPKRIVHLKRVAAPAYVAIPPVNLPVDIADPMGNDSVGAVDSDDDVDGMSEPTSTIPVRPTALPPNSPVVTSLPAKAPSTSVQPSKAHLAPPTGPRAVPSQVGFRW